MQLLKFYAEWCTPCKSLTKAMESITFPYPVEAIDIEQDFDKALKYGIRGVPALVLVDDEGTVITKHVGALTESGIISKFVKG